MAGNWLLSVSTNLLKSGPRIKVYVFQRLNSTWINGFFRSWSLDLQQYTPGDIRTMSTTCHGTLYTQNYSAVRASGIDESFSGMQGVCVTSRLGSLVLDTLAESRYVQQVSLRVPVARTAYSPDGRSLIYTTTKDNLFWLEYCRKGDDAKEEWHNVPFDFTCPDVRPTRPSVYSLSNSKY